MKIYFASGKMEEFDVSVTEYNAMINKIKGGGIRLLRLPNGNFVPLNSNTIELIDTAGMNSPRATSAEPTVDQKIDKLQEEIAQTKEQLASETGVLYREIPAEMQKQEPKVLSGTEREANILAEIKAKSDCIHDGGKLKLYKSTGKKGTRYFEMCSFCGYRSKFIKAEKLSEEAKANAIEM